MTDVADSAPAIARAFSHGSDAKSRFTPGAGVSPSTDDFISVTDFSIAPSSAASNRILGSSPMSIVRSFFDQPNQRLIAAPTNATICPLNFACTLQDSLRHGL